MEEKLFWISMTSGLYGLILKAFMKDERRVGNWRAVSAVNGLFWAIAAAVIGILISSYQEWQRPSAPTAVAVIAIGFVAGYILRAVRGQSIEVSRAVLKDNLEWADTGFSAILLAAVIMYFLVQAFKIPSGSMRLTLQEGDHLFVNKLVYGVRIPYTGKKIFRFRPVKRQDVVVFRFPTEDSKSPHYGKDFIKRAIGLPGDKIEVKNKKVYVNNVPLDEPYTHFEDEGAIPRPPKDFMEDPAEYQESWRSGGFFQIGAYFRDNFGPVTVPPGTYFCMGDNRDRSFDSRFWGPMPDRYLKGRAWFVYWPLSRRKFIR